MPKCQGSTRRWYDLFLLHFYLPAVDLAKCDEIEVVSRSERMKAHRKDIADHIETLFRPIQAQVRNTHEEELRKPASVYSSLH